MEPLFLTNLSSASVDPRELVNRDADAQWLHDGLTAWLSAQDPTLGGAFCVLGEKGIGKSILTRRVLSRLRQVHATTTLFLAVDCRPLRTQRDVYREAATRLVEELALRQGTPEALLAEARALDTLTRFDEVSLEHAHEHLTQYKKGFDLGGSTSLFKLLETKLDISVLRSQKSIDSLEGSLTIDAARMYELFVQLLEDVRRHTELRVVLYLDNIEELNHEALTRDPAREAVRIDVEALLHLSEAPLALVLNMRTYYSSVLTRRISKRRALARMPAAEQLEIFMRRLEREHADDQARVRDDESVMAALTQLSELARTPLAFLTWAEYVLEEGLCSEADMGKALLGRLAVHDSTVARFIPKIAALFDDPEATVSDQEVRDACGRSDSVFRQLIEQQVLLPTNYWDPQEFHLDPEFSFLVGRSDLLGD